MDNLDRDDRHDWRNWLTETEVRRVGPETQKMLETLLDVYCSAEYLRHSVDVYRFDCFYSLFSVSYQDGTLNASEFKSLTRDMLDIIFPDEDRPKTREADHRRIML